ncbi:Uncharacterised protein [Mycobacteroides abscessus subsp. bolletii]|uniref:hypothetical protein n=1 Tax=Mycobacteroides abscessus TaxID=36809 RepID=UPI0002F339FE|nr:hypothetical protein [Mycobacteroides abscessus]MBN7300625.1 hypothetical protein [Mycobacteroides abscessus subsp. bolletii]MBN7455477.1 hypothetical protein [Mycobacteroides abscessus subsp. abscessus]MBN7545546.1 hypothetical protein [Mycobacteroides abscessus subsp. abscessus]MBN7569466.1 hypothetical protein [Mycobacteroides abscessus subsp. abscessus]MDO2969180.1 hypothetical protein [Mycobacteroides abscessus subsp. bolletii]
MSRRRGHRATRRWVAALALSLCLLAAPAPMAQADICGPGDFGASAGCAPPAAGTGGDKAESWPPTDVDWPPGAQADSDADKKAASMPIVRPQGTSASAHVLTSGDPITPPSPIVTPRR